MWTAKNSLDAPIVAPSSRLDSTLMSVLSHFGHFGMVAMVNTAIVIVRDLVIKHRRGTVP